MWKTEIVNNKENRGESEETFDGYIVKDSFINSSQNKMLNVSITDREKTSEYLIGICKRLATVLMSVSKHSTVHSLNHLSQAKNTKQKLLWLMIGCAALVGFVINLYGLIIKYLERPVLTNIFHDYTNFVYPDVTICNVNPLYFGSGGAELNASLHLLIDKFSINDKLIHKSNSKSFDNPLESHENPDISDLLFVQKNIDYSHPAWSMIIKCIYMQTSCHWSQFEIRHIWPFGNCFTFNVTKMRGKRSRNIQKTMIKNAWRPDFKIIIYKGLSHLNKFGRDPFNNINTPTGILVMIHEAETFPYRDEGIFVDSFTQIDLKGTTKIHINVNNRCNMENMNYEYYDFKTNKCQSFVGRQSDCISNLVQENIGSSCKCVLHTIPVPCAWRDLPFCIILQHHLDTSPEIRSALSQCIENSVYNMTNHEKHKECHKDLCEHTTFTTGVSHSSYPSVREKQNHYLWLKVLQELQRRELENRNESDLHLHSIQSDILKRFSIKSIDNALEVVQNISADKVLDEDFINRNFMQVRIVPSSLFMDHIKETAEYPLVRLLSDIGGCIGLWVGASLITLFELCYLFLRCIDVCYSYKTKPNKQFHTVLKNPSNKCRNDMFDDSNSMFCLNNYGNLERNIISQLTSED